MAQFDSLAIKDHLRDEQVFGRRLIITTVFAVLLFSILIARLFYLQIIHQEHYATLSENNRVSIKPIQPIRGLIYDRNGVLLAENIPSFTLELVPEHIKNIPELIKRLQSIITITDLDIKRFNKKRKRKRRFEGITLRYRLNEDEVARLSVKQYTLPGVEIRAELSRHYPLGKLTAHTVGYVSSISERELRKVDASNYSGTSRIGKSGIEKKYEKILHGKIGLQKVETNASGRILRVLDRELPIPGNNLYLNIDIRLHSIAEQAFGEHNGVLVAIDPNNGSVLALSSFPSFDPNLFVNGIDTENYTRLRTSPDQPLFNRAIQGRYPPGSTIKPFVGLAGLEQNIIKDSDNLKCSGYYMLKNDERRYRDWKKEGHKETNLRKAIIESCDVYFYDLALNLGIDNISSYLAKFGFGAKTGLDLYGESSALLPTREWKRKTRRLPWFPGETLITGIGQGFMLVTPLQLATATAALSLNGKQQRPQMIYAMQDPKIEILNLRPPKALNKIEIIQPRNWNIVQQAMKGVVHSLHGTARGLNRELKYKMAGKTGTAQVFGIKQDEEYDETKVKKKLRDHALFIAYAPFDKPKIAVAIIVENGGHGGSVAAPIARKVIDDYLARTQNTDSKQ